jgi:hypothetical protein
VDSSLPPEEDIAEITSAFEVAFDPESTPEEWVAAVNAPEATGEQLRATTAGCDSAEVAVGKMYLLDSSNAAVEFRFAGSGIPVADDVLFIGTADLVEGKWKVSEYTIDKIIREAAPFC